jgi:hypothetical protein
VLLARTMRRQRGASRTVRVWGFAVSGEARSGESAGQIDSTSENDEKCDTNNKPPVHSRFSPLSDIVIRSSS